MVMIAGIRFEEPSGWHIAGVGTSKVITKSIPTTIVGVSVSLGGTAFSFSVKSKRHEMDSYVCYVSALVVGASVGLSLFNFGSVSVGPASFPSGGLHPLLRQPFAPGPEGEPGAPTGLLGPCLTNCLGRSMGVVNAGLSFLMLGSTAGLASLLASGNTLVARYAAFKYSGAFWSTGVNTPALSIDVSLNLGIVTHYDQYRARRGDNKMVKIGTTHWKWNPFEG